MDHDLQKTIGANRGTKLGVCLFRSCFFDVFFGFMGHQSTFFSWNFRCQLLLSFSVLQPCSRFRKSALIYVQSFSIMRLSIHCSSNCRKSGHIFQSNLNSWMVFRISRKWKTLMFMNVGRNHLLKPYKLQ